IIGLRGILASSRKRVYKQLKESSPKLKEESSTNGIAAKNPWGSLSKNWGVTDFVEDDYLPKTTTEAVSNVKERLGFKTHEKEFPEENSNIIELSDESQSETSSEEENWCKRSKMPRMRMHADDEEEKIQKRKGKIRNMINHSGKIMDNDLRGKLTAKRRLPPVYHEAIQVVVTNPKAVQSNFTNVNLTEDEDEDVHEVVVQQENDGNEEEEGEIIDDSGSDSKEEYEEEEEEEIEEIEVGDDSASESVHVSSDSSVSEKEVQGPKGSVIKVVQHRPKLASTVSTVWSRLNHSKIDRNDNSQERYDLYICIV
ncbi:PREDICTED: ESF1 homolog, partial [Ceratosolen solmsi marchali]|uniref:ESF1 homolog n=1 Tax=Ceratosolen solmsi marchali TaxID=326594 RepID=A0AAJ7DYY5_9HYME